MAPWGSEREGWPGSALARWGPLDVTANCEKNEANETDVLDREARLREIFAKLRTSSGSDSDSSSSETVSADPT